MKNIPKDISIFIQKQGFVIVSTLDENGSIHSSAKGVVDVEEPGQVYLIDLYKAKTFDNLKKNPTITITSINEHVFKGYSLKGQAEIIEREKIEDKIIREWERKVINRVTKRLIKNIKRDKGSTLHPESKFPHPKYLIKVEIQDIVDLAPSHLKSLD